MAKKKKSQKEIDESIEEKKEEEVIEYPPSGEKAEPKPEPKAVPKGEFLATEWAKQDPDKPDPHLFLWWDKEGAIPKSKYEEAKAKVFKKK